MRKLRLKKINLSKFKIKLSSIKLPKLKKNNPDNLGLKKYKLNKEKVKKRLPLAIGIILIIIALAVFPNTLSRYASSGVSGTNINVAYSLLDVVQTNNNVIVDSVKLPEVNPDGKFNDYVIAIRNWKQVEEDGNPVTKIINVKMKYYIEITVTTNLPMIYKMEVTTHGGTKHPYPQIDLRDATYDGPCNDTVGESIGNGLYCDSHHTYYYKFTYPKDDDHHPPLERRELTYGSKMEDLIKLRYSLPESYNSSYYQDIIEMISVKIHAEQSVINK